ncbi:MAG: lysophospholipid acyltransferase family protein [Alphaproteobacteria bacterium]
MAQMRAVLLFMGFMALTALSIPIQFVLVRVSASAARHFPSVYFKAVCALVGIRIRAKGRLMRERPVLLAANHTSYFDIVILGSLGPVSFISKSEVADWPLFGTLARLARTVFVERQRRSKTGQHRDMIQARLYDGDSLVLFPEGTSTDGNHVLTFKSALMGAAQPAPCTAGSDPREIWVQPVAVAYTRLHGLPMGRLFRPFFAWYGDMDLVPHLWEAFQMGPFDVDVHFYPPVRHRDFASRRDMAAHCEHIVAAGVGHALSGRSGLAEPDAEALDPAARNGSADPAVVLAAWGATG